MVGRGMVIAIAAAAFALGLVGGRVTADDAATNAASSSGVERKMTRVAEEASPSVTPSATASHAPGAAEVIGEPDPSYSATPTVDVPVPTPTTNEEAANLPFPVKDVRACVFNDLPNGSPQPNVNWMWEYNGNDRGLVPPGGQRCGVDPDMTNQLWSMHPNLRFTIRYDTNSDSKVGHDVIVGRAWNYPFMTPGVALLDSWGNTTLASESLGEGETVNFVGEGHKVRVKRLADTDTKNFEFHLLS